MTVACPYCAAQMPEGAAYCPGCGRSMDSAARASGMVGALPERIAGALAYLTFIPAVVFLRLAPYNKNRFVRFHSWQCIFVWIAAIALGAALKLLSLVLLIIPLLGEFLVLLIPMVIAIGAFALWLVLVVKALQGEMFRLPLIGEVADRMASGA